MKSHYRVFCALLITAGGAPAAGQDEFAARLSAAAAYETSGDFAGAERVLTEVLGDLASLGRDDPRKGIVLHELGSAYHSQGKYLEAEARYLAARDVLGRVDGPDSAQFVQPTLSLAALYLETAQYAKAERLGLRQLSEQLRATRQDSADYAKVACALGTLAYARGRYSEAESEYRLALALWEKLAPNSVEMMQSLNNMGRLLNGSRRHADALRCYEQALRVAETALGPTDPQRVKLLASIGATRYLTGGAREAEPFFKDALSIGERTLGPQSPVVGEILLSYSVLLQKTKRKAEARQCRRRAEAILGASRTAGSRYTVDVGELLQTSVRR